MYLGKPWSLDHYDTMTGALSWVQSRNSSRPNGTANATANAKRIDNLGLLLIPSAELGAISRIAMSDELSKEIHDRASTDPYFS